MKKQHGGKRLKAGRKPLRPEQRRTCITVWISRRHKAVLDDLKAAGVRSLGAAVEHAIDGHLACVALSGDLEKALNIDGPCLCDQCADIRALILASKGKRPYPAM